MKKRLQKYQRGRDDERARIVTELRALRDEIYDKDWSPKRGVLNLCVLIAENHFDKNKERHHEGTEDQL